MSWWQRFNWPILAPAIILAAGLVCLLTSPGGLRTETLTVSLQVSSLPLPTLHSDAVALVNIDEQSLADAGPWPWPRTQIAALIQATHDAGARNILVALPFEGPDAASPPARCRGLGTDYPGRPRVRRLDASTGYRSGLAGRSGRDWRHFGSWQRTRRRSTEYCRERSCGATRPR